MSRIIYLNSQIPLKNRNFMKLNKQLFDLVAKLAAELPRLSMNYDLRDSEEEDGQRMLSVLLPGTKSAIHRYTDTSEVDVCIYGSAIERFYDDVSFTTFCTINTQVSPE